MGLPLSVPIITKDEESNLPRCLESLAGLAAEIIVMDSGSIDSTEQIARAAGARWVPQAWLGYRDQKNAALELCTEPWVLALDADEELSPQLRAELLTFFQNGDSVRFDGASFPRKVFFLGRWIRHGDWYPDRKLRLIRRGKAHWAGSPEHDFLQLEGREKRLGADLHHYSFPDINTFLRKIAVFGDEYLRRQIAAGQRWSLVNNLFRPPWRFFRAYVLRAGFRDGFPGFWIAVGTAFQAFVRHSRAYEYEVAVGQRDADAAAKASSRGTRPAR
ncbi:MAG: glycosyltransferase family 2 protein [Verrucomicrobiales bacterium]